MASDPITSRLRLEPSLADVVADRANAPARSAGELLDGKEGHGVKPTE